jgi:glycosyltransferase involved in cell wall biosynthesis
MKKAHMKASAGRVLMLVENEFPRDTRVRNEAFTLASKGFQVSVVALRGAGEKLRESLNGVTVYRLPRLTVFRKLRDAERSGLVALANKVRVLVGYIIEYLYFTTGCLVVSCYVALKDGFDVVHAHNPPDTLFIVGAFHKLFGKKFVFDHHDLCPELYQSRYATPSGLVSRGLALCEKASVKIADVVIATNESYREIDIRRNGVEPSKVFVVRNGPDLSRVRLTDPDPVLRGKARVVLGYLGAMNPQDGVDYMVRALRHLRYRLMRSDFYCVAIGHGDSLEELKSLAVDLGLEDCLMFTGFISDEDMVRLLSTVDICLDPNPSSPLNDVSTWIKVMEYMALGKPLVSFDLKETRVSAAGAALYVKPNDEAAFAGAIARLMDDPAERARMGEVGRTRVHNELGWHVTSKNLLDAYEFLLGRAARRERVAAFGEARRDA